MGATQGMAVANAQGKHEYVLSPHCEVRSSLQANDKQQRTYSKMKATPQHTHTTTS